MAHARTRRLGQRAGDGTASAASQGSSATYLLLGLATTGAALLRRSGSLLIVLLRSHGRCLRRNGASRTCVRGRTCRGKRVGAGRGAAAESARARDARRPGAGRRACYSPFSLSATCRVLLGGCGEGSSSGGGVERASPQVSLGGPPSPHRPGRVPVHTLSSALTLSSARTLSSHPRRWRMTGSQRRARARPSCPT